ncbi:MAG TPA: response regulator transcription factor [Rubrobacter sp.]|nr:response regulator transcription factor [Rubrobacter sp.]
MEAEGTHKNPTRVLIADDHALFRFGLKAALRAEEDFEVVGEADSGESVVSLAAQLKPQIILMDIQMPGFNGIEATRRILEADPDVVVVVVTMFEEDDSVFAAMRAGARGYVLKEDDADEMIRVIRAVAEGEAHFGQEIARKLRGFFSRPTAPKEVFPELTPREGEVLDMIARGLNNAEISRRLYVSPKTVRNHVSNIFLKLQVADRSQAIVRAREAGLGRDGP